ncbi:vesicular glutamate transporter 1 [Plakobranchus ocellatus]|uniref:Vesicular glutamate transporter 1 n=1 Tax=Plakobranchus ocellatus TaxID=259542 RepID=A0AAV4C0M3_9GAST|nr:vesicular glutamate transporter 1 [Plakobranchus ocellatus]
MRDIKYEGYNVEGVLKCQKKGGSTFSPYLYLQGGLALLWSLLWHFMVHDSPSTHPTISIQEKQHIMNSLNENSQKSRRVPWRGMFTSPAFWSLIFTMLAMGWVDYTVMTSLPEYLKDMLDFDISQDGLLSAIPSVCQFASSITVGPLADFMRGRGVPTGMVRKMFQFATFVGRGLCLLAAGYVTHDKRYVAVALLGLSGLFAGLQQAGYVANFIDIAPR